MSAVRVWVYSGWVAALCACTGDYARAIDTPYQQIVDRNVFALKPPTPPPTQEPNRPPPPNIKMTGIFTFLGKKHVLLKVAPLPKPGVKTEEESYTMALGERQGELEVLDIDEKLGVVKVNAFGTVTNLTWENNGVKVAASAPPPNPGGGGAPNPNPFNPGSPVHPQGQGRVVPTTRPMRPGATSNYGNSGYGNPGYGNPAGNSLGFNSQNTAPPAHVATDAAASPEQQVLMMEAYRMQHKNDETSTLLPTTEFTPGTSQPNNPPSTPSPSLPYPPGGPQRPF